MTEIELMGNSLVNENYNPNLSGWNGTPYPRSDPVSVIHIIPEVFDVVSQTYIDVHPSQNRSQPTHSAGYRPMTSQVSDCDVITTADTPAVSPPTDSNTSSNSTIYKEQTRNQKPGDRNQVPGTRNETNPLIEN